MRKDDGTQELRWAIQTAFPQIPNAEVHRIVRLMRRANEKRGGA